MTPPPAAYARVRLRTTLITSVVWFLILYLSTAFARGGRSEHMSPLEMANVVLFVFLFIPYITTHGVMMKLFKAVLGGRMIPPEPSQDAGAAGPMVNPWRLASIHALMFGLPPALIGYFLASHAEQATMTRGVFAIRYALAGSLLCLGVGWVTSGKPFLRTMSKSREQRAFTGTPDQYLWRYYALPHGIANFFINGVLAFALSPVPAAQVGAIVPARNIIVDTVIACVILTWLLTAAARSQARNEVPLGIAPASAASNKSILKAFGSVLLGGIGFAVIVGVVFAVTKTPGIGVWSWAVYRAIVFGVYAAVLTKAVAGAAIDSVLNAQPESGSATSAVAS